MTCAAELNVWAERLLESLDETGVTTARVVTWFQNNLYKLNLSLGTSFYTESGCLLPELTLNQSGIYETIYICEYFHRKANANLGAAAWDWTEIEGDKQGKIRRVSRNEIAKNYRTLANDCKVSLAELIKAYNEGDGVTLAGQVLYGDRGQVADHGLMHLDDPISEYRSPYSTVWRSSNHD